VSEQEQKRLERLRRTLMNLVVQHRDDHPNDTHTLDIRIVPKESAQRVA
jgi:hypothetical protein